MKECIGCHQPPDAPCGECGRPFDGWAIHYTTTVCAVCGDVYQIEYRVCEQCHWQSKGLSLLATLFTAELDQIADADIRATTEAILALAPAHYATVPSSSTGKYHPISEICEGGQVLHTRRVVRLARELGRKDSLPQDEMDLLTAAAIVHDLAKFGWGATPTRHSQRGHEYNLLFYTREEVEDQPRYHDIVYVAMLHSGQWGPKPMTDDSGTIRLGALLHTADYLASRNYVLVDLEIGDSR